MLNRAHQYIFEARSIAPLQMIDELQLLVASLLEQGDKQREKHYQPWDTRLKNLWTGVPEDENVCSITEHCENTYSEARTYSGDDFPDF